MKTKVIVVTGGVYSSLGKGIVASSIGCILKHGNYNIAMLKLDPYLNTDPGLLSPMQHGEVFITEDGQKTDLDLGHYERFTGLNLTKAATQTGGKLYTEILNDEKQNKYNGATIQIVPHLTNKIIEKINYAIKSSNNPDFLIIEIGGTVGDIESLAFIEAVRLYHAKYQNVLFIHCSPLFQLSANDEVKTKPTQHSIKTLRNLGVNPGIMILRFKDYISDHDKEKLSWTCDVKKENIFISKDCKYLYEVPAILFEQGIHKSILNHFKMKNAKFNMKNWNSFLQSIYSKKNKKVKVCILGSYTELNDSYLSIIESLKIASYKIGVDLNFELVDINKVNNKNAQSMLKGFDGFFIPDGQYTRKHLEALKDVVSYCIKNNKSYFGIKLGMQAIIEQQLELGNDKYVTKLSNSEYVLGLQSLIIKPKTLFNKIYKSMNIEERHWNNWYLDDELLTSFPNSLIPAIFNQQNHIEAVEIKDKNFIIGTIFHPEYVSKPNHPHPLFEAFVKSL